MKRPRPRSKPFPSAPRKRGNIHPLQSRKIWKGMAEQWATSSCDAMPSGIVARLSLFRRRTRNRRRRGTTCGVAARHAVRMGPMRRSSYYFFNCRLIRTARAPLCRPAPNSSPDGRAKKRSRQLRQGGTADLSNLAHHLAMGVSRFPTDPDTSCIVGRRPPIISLAFGFPD